jgi:hypothetical protein
MTITKRNRLVRHLASVLAARAGRQAEAELAAQRDEGLALAREHAALEYQRWLDEGGDPGDPYRADLILETEVKRHAPWGDRDWDRVYEDAARDVWHWAAERGLPELQALVGSR